MHMEVVEIEFWVSVLCVGGLGEGNLSVHHRLRVYGVRHQISAIRLSSVWCTIFEIVHYKTCLIHQMFL